jgi:hypothetical protein
MNISGKITGIKYQLNLQKDLKIFDLNNFDINKLPASALITTDKTHSFAISKWVSPKRTRSYPYERIYNVNYVELLLFI